MEKEKIDILLSLKPIPLKVDYDIIIDSANNNNHSWQLIKSAEEAIGLADILLKAKKKIVANEHVCKMIADATIQIAVLAELYGVANIQLFIDDRLKRIHRKNKRLSKKGGKVGFR